MHFPDGSTNGTGTFTASTSVAIPPLASGISQSKYVKRKWNIINDGVIFSTFSPIFYFESNDLIGSPNTNNFIVKKLESGVWSFTTTGTKTTTSTQATGLGSFTNLEFAIGEPACTPPFAASAENNSPLCAGSSLNLSSAGSGTAPLAYSWSGPNNFTSTEQNPTINNTTTAASGLYTVTISNACGSTQASTDVNISAASTFYRDSDGDGYGDAAYSTQGCATPEGYVTDNADCNDNNNAIHPGTNEICDGIDNDCDGQIDVSCPAGALDLDGVNDYVDLGGYFNYQTFTIEMWVKPGATQVQYANIIDNNHTDGKGWVLQQSGDNLNQYYFGGSTGVSQSFSLAADVWQHIAIVSTPGTKTIYVNGIPVVNQTGTPLITYVDDEFLRLGRWGNGGRHWNGSMDELRIWNRPLCPSEIQHYMNNELPFTTGNGLIAYYKMNSGFVNEDNSGQTTLADETGLHSGTLNNFALIGANSNWINGNVSSSIELLNTSKWYLDADEDGYGDPADSINSCNQPEGYIADNADCNDSDANVHPGAPEICDGEDNDCNGEIDDVQSTTQQLIGNIPSGRSYAIGFSINDKIYVGGGAFGFGKNDFWEYDPSINTWTQKADIPGGGVALAVSFTIGIKGYIATGYKLDSGNSNELWEYNPANDTWTRKTDLPSVARERAVGFSLNGKGYVGGGYNPFDGINLSDFWEYNPTNDTWTQKSDIGGGPRQYSVGFSIGSKGYIGIGSGNPGSLNDFWEYEPSTNVWTRKADVGGGVRLDAIGFSIGTKGYIALGRSSGSAIGKKDIWQYNPTTDTWIQKPDFSGTARMSAVSIATSDKAFLGFGYDGQSSTPLSDWWEFDPGIKTYYQDSDGDGFGNSNVNVDVCAAPQGYVSKGGDCNDNDATIHPGVPTIICKNNQTRGAVEGECTYTAMNNEFNVTANDNCGGVLTYSYQLSGATTGSGADLNGQIFNIGITTVNWTATDETGTVSNPCSFTVTVVDNEPPTIICASSVTINTTPGLCTGTTTLTPPMVTDNCSSFGNALSFDGGYVEVPDAPSLTPLNEWTLETWVRRTTSDVQEGLIEKYAAVSGTYGYLLRIDGNRAFAGFVFTNSGGHFITGNTTLLPDTWYHVATTFNRTTGEMKLYVNGVLDGQLSGITGLPVTPNSGSLKIGARGDDAIFRLSNGGMLDEVRIWNIERTQAQIQAGMNTELAAQPGLVALYHLNEGVAGGTNTGLTMATDASGNSNNGTLVNFELTGPTSNWVSGQFFGLTLTSDAPDTYPIGITTVTWTATDGSGNTTTCTQLVTVEDNQQPVITSPVSGNTNRNTNAGVCTYQAILTEFDATAIDNCGVTSLTYQLAGSTIDAGTTLAGVVFNKGVTTVTWTASDGVTSNVTSSFTVTVVDSQAYYQDADGDGYGNPAVTKLACSVVAGYVTNNTDCNDGDASIYAGATEICDGKDNDCDGQIDEGVKITYYRDTDGDGYGNALVSTQACSTPAGYVNNNMDCNDNNGAIKPGATEICGNGIDENCDGQIDEGCPAKSLLTISDATVYESTGSVTLSVSLSKKTTQPVTFSYVTVDGTARSKGNRSNPADFIAKSGTLTIPAGSQSASITISILNDNVQEPSEQFTVQLSKPVNAAINDGIGTVTILDGSALLTVAKSIDDANKVEPVVLNFSVKASPNPSRYFFTLITESNNQQMLNIKVVDVLGRLMESRSNVVPNSTLRMGDAYRPGVYFIEVTQGSESRQLKLVKQAN